MSRLTPTSILYIDSPRQLRKVIGDLKRLDRIGLDTEFHAERRYTPELMSVQIAAPDGRVWILDPLRIDLRPLAAVLETLEWVAHGSATDIALIYEVVGAKPKILWDTQLIAAMTGQGFPTSLAVLAQNLLGISLNKSVSLSDWSQRPLSSPQIRYAAEDALVTMRLYEKMCATTATTERQEWARAAGDELVAHTLQRPDPTERWMPLNVVSQFDEDSLKVLTYLYDWREDHAHNKDQPPHYTLSDSIALDLARRKPSDMDSLTENRRIPAGLIRRYGRKIISLVTRALDDTERPPQVPTTAQRRLALSLQVWATAQENDTQLASTLTMPPSLARLIAMHGLEVWDGWREAALGDRLARFLSGETSIGLRDGEPVILSDSACPASGS